ncbi:M-phase inducer phosphatase-like [Anthonomus grandis grandis]|uniref:M-phase inducer phosphatase-like n=1 Tax=Anthonomus grandis grandis TaxID=2921223 RepID=UPI00216512C9|nr:M-phase inducer phosphatase-like [Anthonomus grandis grandis]
MSSINPSGFSPKLSENTTEISLFDPDTKDSGFSEDPVEHLVKFEGSPLSLLEDHEATMIFSPTVPDSTPNKKGSSNKKRLFLSPSNSPSFAIRGSLKRLRILNTAETFSELPLDFNDKILQEHSDDEEDNVASLELKDKVKLAVDNSEGKNLIGDFSKNYALPVISGCHPDLKSISIDTMKDILQGKYVDILTSFMVIDSRYPYEFHGGHIKGAVNIYTKENCLELLNKPLKPKNERHILIFHCEFSKERGPKMIRSLRREDRIKNAQNYPALNYPEIYVLEGGYKKFYQTYSTFCEPDGYKQMLHPGHSDEMRFFKKKSKSEVLLKASKNHPRSTAVRKFLSNEFF